MFGSELMNQFFRRLNAASQVVDESSLPNSVLELVRLRASQINGCCCTDMHTKDALAAGEDPQRLNLVAAWRDAKVFTEAERAALALAEEGTHSPRPAYARALAAPSQGTTSSARRPRRSTTPRFESRRCLWATTGSESGYQGSTFRPLI
jgi:AhpD family alkylhydroperoxidase